MILFQSEIAEHQQLAEHYRELAAKREALAQSFIEVQSQAQTDLGSLKTLVEKCSGLGGNNAIASLKSAVLELFGTDDGNDGGGNQPTDPAPGSDPCDEIKEDSIGSRFTPGSTLVDEVGSYGLVIGTNNLGMSVDWLGLGEVPNPASGKGVWYRWSDDAIASLRIAAHDQVKLFTTDEFLQFQHWDKDQLDELWDGEWVSDYGCQYRWGGATINRWIVVFADSCEWASPFTSPIACLLWVDAPLLGQHCTITPIATEDNKNKCTQEGEAMAYCELVKVTDAIAYQRKTATGEIICTYIGFRTKTIAQSWIKFFEAISSNLELRQAKRMQGFKWEMKVKGLSINQIERYAKDCDFAKSYNSTESPAQVAGIEPPSGWKQVQVECDRLTCTLEEGDVVEVLSDRHAGYKGHVGTLQLISRMSELPFSIKFANGHVRYYPRTELKFIAKGESGTKTNPGLHTGQVLMGNRVVTTGAYVGAARRSRISNARRGTADKVAAMQLVKDGLDPETAMAIASGTPIDDASEF
jgi:hypothetical protein